MTTLVHPFKFCSSYEKTALERKLRAPGSDIMLKPILSREEEESEVDCEDDDDDIKR